VGAGAGDGSSGADAGGDRRSREREIAVVDEEHLRFEYERTIDVLRSLTDVRFKLLALVPTLAGTGVAFLGRSASAAQLLAVGLLGLAATLGVLLYELGNQRTAEQAVRRADELETRLGLDALHGLSGSGGLARMHGLALVYGAALAGWTYAVAWGGLRALDVGDARRTGGAIGIAVGIAALVDLVRIGRRRRGADAPADAGASVTAPR
jgi:hypothetical protein